MMQYSRLGRTNLKVSVAGLGCGGWSRLGLSKGLGEDNSIKIIHKAIELGVNFFDTAAIYMTEEVLGKALSGTSRNKYVISSKFSPSGFGEKLLGEDALMVSLEKSLFKLKTDHIDVFLLHGVTPELYIEARDRFYPKLQKAQKQGKIRFIGLSEYFNRDTGHEMSKISLEDNLWDVLMVGYNLINSSARKTILPLAKRKDVGILDMFAVRRAFSDKSRLLEIIDTLIKKGELNEGILNKEDPLRFLLENNVSLSMMDAAYRFCRHSNGIDVVLTGTSSVKHLTDNVNSILSKPLPDKILERIFDIFGDVDSVSGQ